jgi:hypothetical protein
VSNVSISLTYYEHGLAHVKTAIVNSLRTNRYSIWNQGFALALPHVLGGDTKRLFLILRSYELL